MGNLDLSKRYFIDYVEKYYWNVKGRINLNYFSLKDEKKLPNLIFTTNKSKNKKYKTEINFISLGKATKSDLWGLSSYTPLEEKALIQLFKKIDKKWEDYWKITFPSMKPKEFIDKFILDKNLFYLNAIDSLAPTIETSIIMAKNISRLIANS